MTTTRRSALATLAGLSAGLGLAKSASAASCGVDPISTLYIEKCRVVGLINDGRYTTEEEEDALMDRLVACEAAARATTATTPAEALKANGAKTAPCVYIKCSDDEAELWEIDENLRRNEYSDAARADAMKRRKVIYKRNNPKAYEHGGDRKSDSTKIEIDRPERFSLATAKVTSARP